MRCCTTYFFLFFLLSHANAQINDIIEGAEDVADMAELVAITADILEATSFTREKLKACRGNLKQLDLMIGLSGLTRYVPENRRRTWATKVQSKIRTVEMYSTILTNILKMLTNLKEDLAKHKVLKGEIGRAIKQGVSNAMVYVKKIPVYGEIIDSVAEVFGAGSKNSDMLPIEDAVLSMEHQRKTATLEEQLVEFLLRINEFNEGVTKLERDTQLMTYAFGSNVSIGLMCSVPNRSIHEYATRKNLLPK
jgi:hypothetical protein